jgi:transcriptional regulator with XRE-family HTH domain
MTEKKDPGVLALLVSFLRSLDSSTQTDFGKRSGVSQAALSRFEAGLDTPSEAQLQRMAEAAGVAWPIALHLIRFFTIVLETVRQPWPATSDAGPLGSAVLDAVRLAVAPYLLAEEAAAHQRRSPEEDAREAEQIWERLKAYPPQRRRELLAMAPPQARAAAALVAAKLADEE